MREVIANGYLEWPASKGDLIKVMCWVGNEPVQTHMHEFIEISFIAMGSCTHKYHNSEVKLIPGDIFVITPHERHSYEITSKTVIYNCLFYPEVLGEDWNKLKNIMSIYDLLIVEPFYRIESGRHEILHLLPPEVEYIESLLKKMLEEQENRRQGFELMQKSNLINFLCTLGRIWDKQFEGSSRVYLNRRDMLAEAIIFIEKDMKDKMSVKDIASKVYLSPNYFRKVFKEVTGLTPIDYINSIRISKARKLLAEGKMSITEVAETVGINDLNYFSRLFNSMVGCSPSEFRRKSELY